LLKYFIESVRKTSNNFWTFLYAYVRACVHTCVRTRMCVCACVIHYMLLSHILFQLLVSFGILCITCIVTSTNFWYIFQFPHFKIACRLGKHMRICRLHLFSFIHRNPRAFRNLNVSYYIWNYLSSIMRECMCEMCIQFFYTLFVSIIKIC